MRLMALLKPGSLSLFQIKIIRKFVLIASHRRSIVNKVIGKKITLDQLDLYRIKPSKLSDEKKTCFSMEVFFLSVI